MSIRGSLDTITPQKAAGWAYCPDVGKPLFVQAILNQEVLGEAVADEHRADLAAIGMGDGRCGYTISFHRPVDPLYLPFVLVKPEGGDVALPRYSATGFVEFFEALYRAHPAAGRHRSLLGGLWTDRTDAAALLRGKVAIGQIDEATAEKVARLIHDGIVVVAGAGERAAEPAASLADWAAALLGGGQVLRLLQAVLEDRPVVVRAEEAGAADAPLSQPSAAADLPSPCECIAVVAPKGDEPVEIDVVRDSHKLPEFTPDGVSRWTGAKGRAAAKMPALQHALLDRYSVKPASLAVIGPGVLYKVRMVEQVKASRFLLAASRNIPARIAQEGREQTPRGDLRLWL